MGHPAQPLKIAFGHPEGELSAPWFRAYKSVKRKMRRAGLNVQVELLPVTALAADVDVLVLRAPLHNGNHTEAQTLVGPPEQVQDELDELVKRLVHDERLCYAQAPSRTFAVHQGFRPLTERGRLAE
jgi:alkanesulfonate monooxygenase SsuD/methylene tetrahydromethanopterin reductase-like flavin-dependent oxidoreductase (luciferase family)